MNPLTRESIASEAFLAGLRYGFASGFLACLIVLSLLGKG